MRLTTAASLYLFLPSLPRDDVGATFAEVYDALIAAGVGHNEINLDFDIQPLGVAVNRAVVSMPAPVATANVVNLDRQRVVRRPELLD